jgi:hypothetical protein
VSTPLQQPAAVTTLPVPGSTDAPEPKAPPLDPDALRRLGADLASKFVQYKSDRRLAELKWERNARQYLGIYDPDIERTMDKNRSRAYPKITRVKCVSMLSRLMNLLFPADDRNWTVNPSAVPDLDDEDLQQVLDVLMPPAAPGADMQPAGMPAAPPAAPPADDVIEQAIRDFAKKRAARMSLEIEDQLQELGGNRQVDYVALCRRVLASGIQYGDGILKGPFVEEQQMRTWQPDANGRLTAMAYTAYRPRFENCSLWDYYPDMSAKTFQQMDGQYERKVMSRHQVVMLKQRPDFIASQIEEFLRKWPQGNYVREPYETELRSMGVAINVSQAARNKYEAIVWEGYVHGRDLAAAGADVPEDKLEEDVRANVWVMDGYVVKAEIDPWSQLDTDGEMPMYHHFIFEEDESFLLGNGLPAIVRDSQLGVCAAVRMALDNGAVQRNIEINTALLRLDQDITSIEPDKIWYRDDDSPQTAQYPAIRVIELPLHLAELAGLVKMFQEFADQETFVNAATGGDMQRGPSEPFRTATGASMLRGDAALPFKDVVRNFDVFTESVIGSMLIFNRNFNTNPAIKGDFQAVARGATSLIAKEVQGIQLDNLAQTLTPEEKQYIKMRELVRARIRVRDLESDDIVMNDAECDQVDQQTQQNQQIQQAAQQKLMEAQVREILAAALKDIAQAGKNTAAGEATTANVVLDALEKGISPAAVIPALSGAGNVNPVSGTPGGPGAAAPGVGVSQPGPGIPGGDVDAGAMPASGAAAFAPGPSAAAMPAA